MLTKWPREPSTGKGAVALALGVSVVRLALLFAAALVARELTDGLAAVLLGLALILGVYVGMQWVLSRWADAVEAATRQHR